MGAGEVLAYEYSYTSNGQLSMLDDHIDGKRTSYKYDPTSRMAYYTVSDIPTNGQSPESDMFVRLSYDDYSRLTGKYTALGIPALADDATVQDMYLGVYESYGYDHDGTLTGMSYSTNHDVTGDCVDLSISYGYDYLDRLSSKSFTLQSFDYAAYDYAEFELSNIYTYKLNGIYSTGLINSFIVELNETRVDQYNYTYDNNGNITKITTSSGYEYRYVYDDLGQLIREDNSENNNTYLYTYDNAGNILSKQICPYTAAGVTPTPTTTYTYTYGNSNWGDQLTAYRGVSFEYDAIGNPVTYYNGKSYVFTWTQGRRLASAAVGTYNLTYKYNSDGIRTSKTVNDVEYKYTLDGTKILTQEWGNEMLVFLYDEAGSPVGFQYRNSSYAYDQFDTYWYRKNLQGDVMAIYDADGTTIAWYAYDAFGKQTYGAWRTHASNLYKNIYNLNPYRYRGYYYDTETSLYYLNSRYYDPATCRFISADSLIDQSSLSSSNLFAYCRNNPVNMTDVTGYLPFFAITAAIGAVVGAIAGGVIAAKNGGNIWVGIGIGAATGAVIGAGAGMTASAALAGDALATTNAVITGGKALIATIGAGGIGAGATFISNNLSQAINNFSHSVQEVSAKMQQVYEKGRAGELAANIEKNTQHIDSLTGTAAYRIPDMLNHATKVLGEVKNYSGTISYTAQLRDFVLWSQLNGYQMYLFTNSTSFTKPLLQLIESGVIRIFPIG